jgi:orotate phosphoribosyltransferase
MNRRLFEEYIGPAIGGIILAALIALPTLILAIVTR